MSQRELMRSEGFSQFTRDREINFEVRLYDLGEPSSHLGHTSVGYELERDGTVLFQGRDFRVPGHVAIDSDKALESLMSFLCLQAGDTDAEFFDNYTPEQLAFRDEEAESLYLEVELMFGEDAAA